MENRKLRSRFVGILIALGTTSLVFCSFAPVVSAAPGLSALAAGPATRQASSGEVSRVGWIVDEFCQQSNANPNGKACTEKCRLDGAALVLFLEEDASILQLDNQELAAQHIGYVRVTGKIVDGTLQVSSIEAQKYQRKRPSR